MRNSLLLRDFGFRVKIGFKFQALDGILGFRCAVGFEWDLGFTRVQGFRVEVLGFSRVGQTSRQRHIDIYNNHLLGYPGVETAGFKFEGFAHQRLEQVGRSDASSSLAEGHRRLGSPIEEC